MRAQEIITLIEWPDAMPADRRHQVEDAIRQLDAKAFGNGRRYLGPADIFRKLEDFVKAAGSANAAAARLGIGKAFLSDIRNSRRPPPPGVLVALGVERAPRASREMYLEI